VAIPAVVGAGACPLLAAPVAKANGHRNGCTCPLCTGAARAALTPMQQMLSERLPWGHTLAQSSAHPPGCGCPVCTGRVASTSIQAPLVQVGGGALEIGHEILGAVASAV